MIKEGLRYLAFNSSTSRLSLLLQLLLMEFIYIFILVQQMEVFIKLVLAIPILSLVKFMEVNKLANRKKFVGHISKANYIYVHQAKK